VSIRGAEAKLRARIRAYLKKFSTVYQFWPVQTGYGTRTVDLLACVDGVFFAVEVKDEREKPTKLQEDTLAEVDTAKGVSFWCDSWEGFLEQFGLHCRKRGLRLVPRDGAVGKGV